MPQLDIYILCELVNVVILLWNIIYILNIRKLLININLNIGSMRIKYFVEKQILKNIYSELFFKKNLKFLKKNLIIKKKNLDDIRENILENILEIFNTSKQLYFILIKKKYIKNNIEFYRKFIL